MTLRKVITRRVRLNRMNREGALAAARKAGEREKYLKRHLLHLIKNA